MSFKGIIIIIIAGSVIVVIINILIATVVMIFVIVVVIVLNPIHTNQWNLCNLSERTRVPRRPCSAELSSSSPEVRGAG